MFLSRRWCWLVLLLVGAACGPASTKPDASVEDVDGGIGCEHDALAMVYQPNLTLAGVVGVLTFTLVSTDPAPPSKGTNTWTLKIVDQSGAPVPSATLKVTPFMPRHGHGTTVVPAVTRTGGQYQISALYFFMPGLWRVAVEADSPSGADSVPFYFCVEG